MEHYFTNLLALTLEAAPWLLLGLLFAGLIHAWVPEALMRRWLGGSGAWPVLKAAVVGAPLPLCSCSVLPTALALRRGGASRGATVAFLIATPETGVDSVALSYALLGPFLTVVRPLAAMLSAVAAGLAALAVPAPRPRVTLPQAEATAACGCGGGSCGGPPAAPSGPLRRTVEGLRHALSDIWDDVAPWLAVGLLTAALAQSLVPPMALAEWGSGLPAMLVMLLAGVPMYICATASTPFAAALLLAGISPGTVLVFLLAGPATNIATLAVIGRELGRATAAVYVAGIAVASLLLGLLTDRLAVIWRVDVAAQLGGTGELVPGWLATLCALLLLAAALRPLRRRLLGA